MKPDRVEWERRELARREEDRRKLDPEDGRHAGQAANGSRAEHPAPAPGELLDAVCRNVAQLAKAAPATPRRIRIRDGQTSVEVEWPDPGDPAQPAGRTPAGEQPGGPVAEEQDDLSYVRSPMVGTFYHASSPEAAPFVGIGDLVQPGQPVGVLEAMKMMSTITSAVGGRVVELIAPNGQAVEFDQRLIALEPVAAEEDGPFGLSRVRPRAPTTEVISMFSTVLIANRGEIALRVARACRELGIRTVAVYSTVDRDSAVVRFADEAVHIGPPAAKSSYLSVPAIIEAALQTGAQAVHPGYGFLSEDPDFAEICEANGIVFIGPPAHVMQQLGDKAVARALMAQAGLPVLPGSTDALASSAEAKELAQQVGYPVILKAVAGGGGRGMAVVEDADGLRLAYVETQAHARAVFGDDRLYLERFVQDARHVEVQVLCDRHGSVIHLGERDCSVQRRHQKLIEEAPAPELPTELREAMWAAAVRGAAAVGFVGAGTFEFVLTPDHEFYLMEINCRLQVEHPITELVTGVDIVREQIAIAAGLPLSVRQDEVRTRGVALECRVNAEDPARDFAPAPGLLTEFVPPGGPFVRIDTHAYPGWRVGPDYDSLLAKAAVWAPDREQAIVRMDRALEEFRVAGPGVRTTIGFLRETLAHPLFQTARHTTGLVAAMTEEQPAEEPPAPAAPVPAG